MSGRPDDPLLPHHGQMLTWFRVNLAIMMAAISVLGAAGGLLYHAGTYIAGQESTLTAMLEADARLSTRIEAGHEAIVDIDKRLNTITAANFDARRALDHDIASVAERIGVLEAQMRFVADRVQQNGPRK